VGRVGEFVFIYILVWKEAYVGLLTHPGQWGQWIKKVKNSPYKGQLFSYYCTPLTKVRWIWNAQNECKINQDRTVEYAALWRWQETPVWTHTWMIKLSGMNSQLNPWEFKWHTTWPWNHIKCPKGWNCLEKFESDLWGSCDTMCSGWSSFEVWWTFTRPHCVISQKIVLFIVTTVRTSNPT
jgi:hypothetical protein